MVSYDNLVHVLRTQEVATMLNVHGNTVRRWSDRGIMRAYRIGSRGDRRYRHDDVNRLVIELRKKNGTVSVLKMRQA